LYEGLRAAPGRAQFPDFPELPGIFPEWQIIPARG
jgi:hypothetical protein